MMVPKFRAWDDARDEYFEVRGLSFPVSNNDKLGIVATAGDQNAYGPNMILEQSTGLKDTSGEDIYEGDLVRLTDDLEDPIYKVIFDEAKFEIIGGGVCYDLGEEFMDCEVIGNVHENPELLEVQHER